MSELPLILAVDEDPEALERITSELQRYARDYKVICGPSTQAALSQLESLRDRDAAVAVVLAARGTQELKGEELLERVHELHPHGFPREREPGGERCHRRTRFLRKNPRFAGRSASRRMR